MTERIAISEETKNRLNDFKEGAGMSYDAVIEMFLELATLPGEDLKQSGVLIGFAKKRGKRIKGIEVEE